MSMPSGTPDSELSHVDLELLARAREQRAETCVPAEVRDRVLVRVMAHARQGEHVPKIPAAAMVSVPFGAGRGLGMTVGLVVSIIALANVRGLVAPSADVASAEPEPSSNAASAAARAGDRLLQAPVFRAPARLLEPDEVLPQAASLFSEAPFAAPGGAWQVRRWNDLKADPGEPASHDFADAALCVAVGAGERVLGGWPWSADGSMPDPVALKLGQRYRLSFKAWAREPLPAQLLVAVGHSRLPFSAAAGARVPVSAEPQPFVVDFVSERDDPSIGVAFLATSTADSSPTRVCLTDVTLSAR